MPLKVHIRLNLSEEINPLELKPDGVHGIFFSILGGESAKILHDGFKNVKPFSLFCKELFKKDPVGELNFELNLLKDDLISTVLSDLLLGSGEDFITFRGKKIPFTKSVRASERWVKTYSGIVEDVKVPQKVEITFLSPTTFRRNDVDYPFPSPELVFRGLVKRWLAFSDVKPSVDLREFYPLVEISYYELKTQKVEFANGGKLTAFVGKIVYNLKGVENEEARRWFGILSHFSNWSGIGRKTTMGLGKVKILTPV